MDSWECRTKADELNYYALPLPFIRRCRILPRTQRQTPGSRTGTGRCCNRFSGRYAVLVWQTVKDGTAAATAVMEAVTVSSMISVMRWTIWGLRRLSGSDGIAFCDERLCDQPD